MCQREEKEAAEEKGNEKPRKHMENESTELYFTVGFYFGHRFIQQQLMNINSFKTEHVIHTMLF